MPHVSDYLLVTVIAYEEANKPSCYDKNHTREIQIKQMIGKALTEHLQSSCLVNLLQVRDIENEEIEQILAGQQTA